ncbi:hypothetical protein ACIRU3_08230 [Streptomyces sp. NPDC101151]|uniref:hypothetical protein n=1 Tax=Streptomyces sp. NPDC101151 TaxID=3366115 RepID=UPI00380D8E3D
MYCGGRGVRRSRSSPTRGGSFPLGGYQWFLAENAESIAEFRAGQSAAFRAERDAWEAAGEFAHAEAVTEAAPPASGVVVPERGHLVEAESAASVRQVGVEVGERVSAGQPLLAGCWRGAPLDDGRADPGPAATARAQAAAGGVRGAASRLDPLGDGPQHGHRIRGVFSTPATQQCGAEGRPASRSAENGAVTCPRILAPGPR